MIPRDAIETDSEVRQRAGSVRLARMLRPSHFAVLTGLLVSSATAHAEDDRVVWQDVIDSNLAQVDRLIVAANEALSLNDRAGAIEAYAEASDLAPDALLPLAFELSLRVQDRDWAMVIERSDRIATPGAFDRAMKQPLFFRAVALAATGAYAEGAEILEAITRYEQDLPEASVYYGNLAELHMAVDSLDDAIAFFRRAIDSGGGAPARVGLASALFRADRPDEAERELLAAVVADPEASFLSAPGVFFVPDGEVFLYRALVAIGRGDRDAADRSLDLFEGSEAAVGDEDLVATLRTRARGRSVEIRETQIPGCVPIQGTLHPEETHVAVLCEYDGLREAPLDGGTVRLESTDSYYTHVRGDITYSPDGEQIRVLNTDGSCAWYDRSGPVLSETGRVFYEQYTLTPTRFVGDGDRILVTASHSGGAFQVDDWDSTPLQTHLSYPVGANWLQQPQISEDESVMSSIDGAEVRSFAGPNWAETSRIPLTTGQSRFRPFGLSPSGDWIVAAHGSTLVRYSTANARPDAVVSLGAIAPEVVADPFVGVSFVRAIDDNTYLVGTSGTVYLIELE